MDVSRRATWSWPSGLRDPDSLERACEGIDAILSTASAGFPRGRYNFSHEEDRGYDNLIRVTTTISDVRSRTITFDYVISNAETGERFVTASTRLASLTRESRLTTMPERLRKVLEDAAS